MGDKKAIEKKGRYTGLLGKVEKDLSDDEIANRVRLSFVPIGSIEDPYKDLRKVSKAVEDRLKRLTEKYSLYIPVIVSQPNKSILRYNLIDGRLRIRILSELGKKQVLSIVLVGLDAFFERLLVLTVNKLRCADQPLVRAELIKELIERFGVDLSELARLLPDSKREIERLLVLKKEGENGQIRTFLGQEEKEKKEHTKKKDKGMHFARPFAIYLEDHQYKRLEEAILRAKKACSSSKKSDLFMHIVDVFLGS